MPTVSASGGKDFELAEAGTYSARCIRVVDLGTHINDYDKNDIKDIRKVMITWEISELMSDGRPFVVNQEFTASISDRSNLGKLLVSWRARPFTDSEKEAFELRNILDVPCLLGVTVTKNGKYNQVSGAMPLPKGMPVNDRVNQLFNFEIEEINVPEQVDNLWPFEKYFIKQSKEYIASGLDVLDKKDDKPSTANEASANNVFGDDDEIPF